MPQTQTIEPSMSAEETIRFLATCRREDELRNKITQFRANQIKSAFANDKWLRNYVLNIWECETGAEVLESYPWNVALPIADICNARCTFCNSWLAGKELLRPDQLRPFLEVLAYAKLIGIQGHGEPLANPYIEEILKSVAEVVDQRADGYIITNGVFLPKHVDDLLASQVKVFNVSLNAVTEQTHNIVMGLGRNRIEPIIESIRQLIALRDSSRPDLQVTISMVITADNIHEAADFVTLGNNLNLTRIYLRSLMPILGDDPGGYTGLNYHLLSPMLAPRFEEHASRARTAIEQSRVPVEAQPEMWGADALSPKLRAAVKSKPITYISRREAARDSDVKSIIKSSSQNIGENGRETQFVDDLKSNPYMRAAPFNCRFVYQNLIVTKLTLEMYPCCYMSGVPGHERVILNSNDSFMEQWNSPAFRNLRRRLQKGPLFQACATCPMQG
jgi:molybdenum cofactor biosynthesis enzyme MoaA